MKTITLTNKQTELVNKAFSDFQKGERTHLNYYTGSGRFSKKSGNWNQRLVETLKEIGLEPRMDFEQDNDAPKGGWAGEFVELTTRGFEKLHNFLIKG